MIYFLTLLLLASTLQAMPLESQAGGFSKLSPDDPIVQSTMQAVEVELDQRLAQPYHYRLGKVVEAYEQVVAGMRLDVTFQLAETKCQIEEVLTDLHQCQPSGKTVVCSAQFYYNPIDESKPEIESFDCKLPTSTLQEGQDMPGGFFKLSPEDPKVQTTMQSVEVELDQRLAQPYHYRLGKVVEASEQVVAGVRLAVTFQFEETKCRTQEVLKDLHQCQPSGKTALCSAQFYYTTMHESKPVIESFDCKLPTSTLQEGQDMPGGFFKLSPNDPKVQTTMQAVEVELDQRLAQPYHYRLGKVVEASEQVVAGVRLAITFQLEETKCRNQEILKDLHQCQPSGKTVQCNGQFYYSPMHHTKPVIESFTCKLPTNLFLLKSQEGQDMPGGFFKLSPEDPKVQSTMQAVEVELDQRLAQSYHYRLGKVVEASEQVVAGVRLAVTFQLEKTKCKIEKVLTNLHQCQPSGKTVLCNGQFYYSPMHHTKPLIESFTCHL